MKFLLFCCRSLNDRLKCGYQRNDLDKIVAYGEYMDGHESVHR